MSENKSFPAAKKKNAQAASGPKTVEEVKSQIVNMLLILAGISGIPAAIIACWRAYETGLFGWVIVQEFFFCCLLLTTLFRRKLPLYVRVTVLLTACYVIAMVEIVSYGLGGTGFLLLLAFGVFSAALFGFRSGVAASCLVLFSLIGVMIGVEAGLVPVCRSFALYALSDRSWIFGIANMGVLLAILVATLGRFHGWMLTTLAELQQQSAALEATNILLQREMDEGYSTREALRCREQFEQQLSLISNRFINVSSEGIDDEMDAALQQLCRLSDVDAGCVFQLSPDQSVLYMSHYAGVQPGEELVKKVSAMPVDQLGWFVQTMESQRYIAYDALSELPAAACMEKTLMESMGVQSLVAVAMRFRGELVGILQFWTHNTPRSWSEEDVSLFEMAAQPLTNALHRKRSEEALRISEKRFKALIEKSSDVIAILDENGHIEYASPAGFRILGYHLVDLTELRITDLVHPHDRLIAGNLLAGILSKPENVRRGEIRVKHQDGTWRVLEVEGINYLHDSDLGGIIATGRDITERREVEAELVRLGQAMEQADEGVLVTDVRGVIRHMNPAFERISGLQADALRGTYANDLISEENEPEVIQDLLTQIRKGKGWKGQLLGHRSQDEGYRLEVSISPVRDSAGVITGYVSTQQDITHAYHLERQLRQAQKMEAVGQLAGGIAHDFNNLLQVIQGYVSLAMVQLDQDHPTYQDLVQVNKAVSKSAELVRQLLTFSRKELLRPENMDLNAVIHELMNMLVSVIGENVALHVDLQEDLPSLYADSGQLSQVIVNLCVNARDAMPQGGMLSISTRVVRFDALMAQRFPGAREGEYVELAVTDSGEGISKELQSRIFEPFFTTKELGRGTGLGLATVYTIVQRHEGVLQIESEPGQGCRFMVYIPAVAPLSTNSTAPVAEGPQEIALAGKETVLIAEDDEQVCLLLQKILEYQGYQVLIARDGEEAINLLEKHEGQIDMAILDVVMPKVGGETVYRHIRSGDMKMPVLFSSGYMKEKDLPDGAELLQKPCEPSLLLHKIRHLLNEVSLSN